MKRRCEVRTWSLWGFFFNSLYTKFTSGLENSGNSGKNSSRSTMAWELGWLKLSLDNSKKGSESDIGWEPLNKMKRFLLYQSPYSVFVTLWIVEGHCSHCRDEKARPRGLMIARGYIVNMRSKICVWITFMFSKVHFYLTHMHCTK